MFLALRNKEKIDKQGI